MTASTARSSPRAWCSPACASLDPAERDALERSEATVIGASTVETLVAVKNALDGAPVYVHLDVDVLDPEALPVQDPAPGGLPPEKLYDLLEAVMEDSELVGLEITAFAGEEGADVVTRGRAAAGGDPRGAHVDG